jgi:hypothetical protein
MPERRHGQTTLAVVRSILPAAAFILGVGVLSFLGGFIIGREWLFPYQLLAPAVDAAKAFRVAKLTSDPTYVPNRFGREGAVVHDRAAMAPGVTFLTGFTREGCEGWIVDADGRELHRWRKRFSEAFPHATQLVWQGDDRSFAWHGAHLFPNGDLLVVMAEGGFPDGGGLVKLDRDSRVLWTLPRNVHHDVNVAEDGTIWVAGHRLRRDPHPGMRNNLSRAYLEDVVLAVSPDGKVIRELSLLDSIAAGYPGLLHLSYHESDVVDTTDPTHLNNVEPLSTDMARHFPMFAAGDLLVSLRNLHTIAVMDSVTGRMKWALTGPFLSQHDPDFAADGTILVLDNRGGRKECGRSRLLRIDPATQAVGWRYEGCEGTKFFTLNRGTVQQLPNGNVLVAEATSGRVFEVTGDAHPRVVWEYVNSLGEIDGQMMAGIVTRAERFAPGKLDFLPAATSNALPERP